MIIHQITVECFRNHRSLAYRPASGVNIICGPNGRGKTNLLEGIYLLTGAKSWRASSRAELITWGSGRAVIRADVTSRGRDFELALDIPAEGKARALINGVPAGRENPLSNVLRTVLFSPDDLQLVKGSPAGRRELMDGTLSQLWPRYAPVLARYSRLLLSKGRLLRQGLEAPGVLAVLPEINAQMAFLGAKIINMRAALCRTLGECASKIHAEISAGAEALALEYRTVSSITDAAAPEGELERALLAHLAERETAEKAAASCLVGPHRDEIEITINGRASRAFASQGQARSAALAMRFAQRELYFADLGEYPVMLLDDILSELDGARRDYVCEHTLGGQSIITCCSPEGGFREANVMMV